MGGAGLALLGPDTRGCYTIGGRGTNAWGIYRGKVEGADVPGTTGGVGRCAVGGQSMGQEGALMLCG